MTSRTSVSSRRRSTSLVASLLLVMLGLSACTESSTGPGENTPSDQPVAATVSSGRPQGLFFMTRAWSGSLEKSAWYFAPDGQVYRELRHGFSAADLAAHDGPRGTMSVNGSMVTITYTDGSVREAELTMSGKGFYWDGSIFTPVTPFANASEIVGLHRGGEVLNYPGGGAVTNETLDLKADGSFRWSGVAFVEAGDKPDDFVGTSSGETTGRWTLSGHSLTLTDAAGVVVRGIVFPYDDSSTPAKHDWFFFSGVMFKRQ